VDESRFLLRQARRSRRDESRVRQGVKAGVRIQLLGAFQIVNQHGFVQLPVGAQKVVAFVALHDRPMLRGYVSGSLWLDSPENRAAANLRTALWRIHRAEPGLIEATNHLVQLGKDVAVDLREAEAYAREAIQATTPIEGMVDLWMLAIDLLPDWYEDFVTFERERFRQLRLRALEELSERLTQAGRAAEALEAGLLSVVGEPLRESGHRALIRAHLANGNPGEAIRQYRLCERLLREQLGIKPSNLTRALLNLT